MNSWYGKQKKDKKNLVPDSALDLGDNPLKETLEKMLFRNRLSGDSTYMPRSAEDITDRMKTHVRTIVSKAYTELFSATTTSKATMTDEEAREFIAWFNGVVAEGLERAGELVIEHRDYLRKKDAI